jgi:hypothetical protein
VARGLAGSWFVLVNERGMCTVHRAVILLMARGTGMLPYTVELVDDDAAVTAYAGLPWIVETMLTLGVSQQLDKEPGRID